MKWNSYQIGVAFLLIMVVLPVFSGTGSEPKALPLKELIKNMKPLTIAILDKTAAEDYTQINESFNSHYSDLHLDFARVLDPDGRYHELSDSAIQVQAKPEATMYREKSMRIYSIRIKITSASKALV